MNTTTASLLVAHRGDHEQHPENSLAAFRQALEAGARWLECDVQFAHDTVAVIFHDDDLQRMCGLERNVADVASTDLPPLPDGQPIPRLTELLQLLSEFPNATLFLEVKTSVLQRYSLEDTVARFEALIADNAQVVPISFSGELLAVWWRDRPRRLGWIGDDCAQAPKIPLAFRIMYYETFLRLGSPPIAAQVGVYTVNDASMVRQLSLRSVDLIETDHFSRLQAELYGG